VNDPLAGEFVWTREQNRHAWADVRGDLDRADPRLGYLSPLLAADLSGLPPALILVGALDLFRDENIAYARRFWWVGVSGNLLVYAGGVRGLDLLPSALADRVRRDRIEGVRRII